MNCPACAREVPLGARFCLFCGSSLTVSSSPTLSQADSPATGVSPSPATPRKVSAPEGPRFVPGTLLGERYRIVALAGKGGMGEVYRADDLKLEQTVALKFLPQALAQDGAALARFHREVRIARQVSHPNVCRVFDIGEVNAAPYLTMEYVDGEDLASLLRRIGRLPPDKALEIARQLCAGLAAAHDHGVIHRDLKPANVMLDGRGKVRITDFGLAGVAADLHGEEGAGTPAYMAPEQLAGKEATVRSDLYALGLLLYEVFTGKRAFEGTTLHELLRLQEQTTPSTPSAHVKDIDPLVERVILRCLEKDPPRRPASALQVAAALPGGDPLAAALAAGETPSPEMVAAAGESEGLRPVAAWAWLATAFVGIFVVVLLNARNHPTSIVPLQRRPEVLEEKARDLFRRLGYTEPAADSASAFQSDDGYLRYVSLNDRSKTRLQNLDPRAISFWYRQSPRVLVPSQFVGPITSEDPPMDVSGMGLVWFDSRGRLLKLQVVPPQLESQPGTAVAPDWALLFAEAGLDPASWTPTEPIWTPPGYADTRTAWQGSLPGRQGTPMRIEAAAFRGKPTSFELIGPWTEPERMRVPRRLSGEHAAYVILIVLFIALLAGGALLVWRNLRLGRGDRKGAFRLALFVFALVAGSWLLGEHHVAAMAELGLFVQMLCAALFAAGFLWELYIALEPYVRRRRPETLVSWSRLLAGGLRDPLVGRCLLIGCAAGTVTSLLHQLYLLSRPRFGYPPMLPNINTKPVAAVLSGGLQTLAVIVFDPIIEIFVALGLLFLLVLLRLVLRREWIAAAVLMAIMATVTGLTSEATFFAGVFQALMIGLMILVLTRFGLTALVAMGLTENFLSFFPATIPASTWYAMIGWVGPALVAGFAIYGFSAAMTGKPLFGSVTLDE
jgi:hypothetical protein